MTNPRVVIVIVSWNAKEYLDKCFRSIFTQVYDNFSVIFVDNGSADGSVDFMKSTFPEVKTLALDRNYGFARGNNIGMEEAFRDLDVKHIVLLNSDTVVHENFLKELVTAAESDPKIGCCQPKMLSVDDPSIVDAVGITLTKSGNAIQLGYGQPDSAAFAERKEVFGACAGAALYRREMLEAIGLLEEECFIYYEDVDLALRARLAGWKCFYVPGAVVYHKHSVAFGKQSPFKLYLLNRNQYYYTIKDLPAVLVFRFLANRLRHVIFVALKVPVDRILGKTDDLIRDLSELRANFHAVLKIPKMLDERKEVRSRRVLSDRDLIAWFEEIHIPR